MGLWLKIFILLCGIGFALSIVYLLLKKKISERSSMLWLFGSFIILILSAIPEALEIFAQFVGVEYPPTLLFLFSTLVLLFIVLHQSTQISVLQDQVRELAQQTALLKHYEISKEKDK